MQMTMRWFGPSDTVTLAHIRQVPSVTGIVSALFEIPVGDVVPLEALRQLQAQVEAVGLRLDVIESIPVHEAIKLGRPDRDRYIENYCQGIRNMGSLGIRVLCYNLMPIFDWMRTDLSMPLPDGSLTMSYEEAALSKYDLSQGMPILPVWANRFTPDEFHEIYDEYKAIGEDGLFQNCVYFLKAIVPTAAEAGVNLALHPDDPPWSIFGLPRIVRDQATIQRLLSAVDDSHNGLTFCTGSLGSAAENNLPEMVKAFAGRINFVHMRNVKLTGGRDFYEVPHPSEFGNVDMYAVMSNLVDTGYEGPIRSDHGRMIWGETGRPAYGLYDRALGILYLRGLYEGVYRTRHPSDSLPR
jgi:mannonate dehydratase